MKTAQPAQCSFSLPVHTALAYTKDCSLSLSQPVTQEGYTWPLKQLFTDAENEGIDDVYDEGRYIVSDEQK